jgi:ribosomal protein S18 acetylase RimI-like enzyme
LRQFAGRAVELRIVQFSAQHLSQVQQFECGPEDWSRLAERWIRSVPPFPGALKSIQDQGNSVWLYYLDAMDEESFVGFASLGVTTWRIPPPDGPKRDAGFIPMFAVATSFQGKPSPAGQKRYSQQILEHVLDEARKRGFREVALFVHENNRRAMRLYEKCGFQAIGGRDERGNLRMLKLLD